MGKLVGKSESINTIGGGANSEIWCQILADVLNRDILKMKEPHLGSARGSAIIAMVGLGLIDNFNNAIPLIEVEKTFHPNPSNQNTYDLLFNEFIQLYKNNKRLFENLNSGSQSL
jgi:xylulokinase